MFAGAGRKCSVIRPGTASGGSIVNLKSIYLTGPCLDRVLSDPFFNPLPLSSMSCAPSWCTNKEHLGSRPVAGLRNQPLQETPFDLGIAPWLHKRIDRSRPVAPNAIGKMFAEPVHLLSDDPRLTITPGSANSLSRSALLNENRWDVFDPMG